MNQRLRIMLAAAVPVTLCAILLSTTDRTTSDWHWITLLSGVLIATHAEWRVLRRTRQLEEANDMLAEQASKNRATEHLLDADARLELLANSVHELILYVGADQICRYHNRALERVLGLTSSRIDDRPLREILGDASYSCIKASVQLALGGEEVRLRQLQRNADGRILAYDTRYIPHVGSGNQTLGFYALLSPWRGQECSESETSSVALKLPSPGLQATAIDDANIARKRHPGLSSSVDLGDWDDPRERFLEALEHDRFDLLQQALVPVANDHKGPRYHEILIRLQDEERNMMLPGAFFPVVVRYRLMGTVDRWVVRHLLAWHHAQFRVQAEAEPACFCINLSIQSVQDDSFARFVQSQLTTHSIRPDTLCFEIAQSDLLADRAQAMRCAGALQALGCHIAVDGFGGEADSFDALQGIPMDFLKIDGGLIGRIGQDPASLAKAKAITNAAHASGARVVAKCVENTVTLAKLRAIGVDYAQGFAVAMPELIDESALPAASQDARAAVSPSRTA